jgi:DNA mismatch repair protein MutL
MKRIHLLSPDVANQIAAGEVVERPSSVLKELLENSLDAGSTHIDVLIKRGGLGLIQVQDNGCGICKDDLQLALSQHATSKISTSEDLEGVLSLGFRGEALASIAAVSKLSLSSKIKEAEHGWCIQKEGRATEWTLTPTSHPTGTRLEIRDLFYNTPARRKFLKSEKTEWTHVQETFKRIALSHPQVAFTLTEGDRLQKRLPACDINNTPIQAKRIAALCGESFIEQSIFLEAQNNGLRLKGWLGNPESSRAQADLQYFYVNGRIVRDKVVTHAVRQAYQDCPTGRYPAYVLYFECDPMSVDVNVHPTKHEVRFREARTVHAFLSYSIQEGLVKAGLASASTITQSLQKIEAEDVCWPNQNLRNDDIPKGVSKQKAVESEPFEQVKPLCVLEGEFLLAENSEGLWIADLKAMHRQSIMKILQRSYDTQTVGMRPLLMPKTVAIGKYMIQYEAKLCDWTRLGFAFDQVGPEQLLVRSVPEFLGAQIENLEILIISLLGATDLDCCLEIMVKHAVFSVHFSTIDAVELLKKLPYKEKEYRTCYKQISMNTLRTLLYKEKAL